MGYIVHGVARVRHDLVTKPPPPPSSSTWWLKDLMNLANYTVCVGRVFRVHPPGMGLGVFPVLAAVITAAVSAGVRASF